MKGLQTLDVNNCNLNGSLPSAWAKNLPALQEINASANALTGAHRPSPLRSLHSASKPRAGRYDAAMHSEGMLAALACAGTLPAQWSTLNMTVINLDRNALTGATRH